MKMPKLSLSLPGRKGWRESSGDDRSKQPERPLRRKARERGGIGLTIFAVPLLIAAALLFATLPFGVTLLSNLAASGILVQQGELAALSARSQAQSVLSSHLGAALSIGLSGLPERLFTAAASAERTQLEQRIAALFTGATRVRLLPLGYAQHEPEALPPISYADIQQLRQAEQGDAIPLLESFLHGTPKQHINIVTRVREPLGERAVGLLMVSFGSALLQQMAREIKGLSGYAEIVQRVGDQTLSLIGIGNAAHKRGNFVASEKLLGTNWGIRYWNPVDARTRLGLPGLELYAVYGGALLLFGVIIYLVFRWLAGVLRQDQAAIINLVSDMLEKGGRSSYPVRMTSFNAMVKLLSGMSPRVAAAIQEPPAVAARVADDFDLFDAEILPADAPADLLEEPAETPQVPMSIFRACDIRGVAAQTLTPAMAKAIGRAIGSEVLDRGEQRVAIARDGRMSSPELQSALAAGLQAAGCEVIDLGMVPTPLLYFATHHLGVPSGVMVTASHNPPDYNGFKIMIAGQALTGQALRGLHQRLQSGDLRSGEGSKRTESITHGYLERVSTDITLARPLKVVVDCANGVAGVVAPELYRAIGCEVIELYCEVDGQFPNHFPDPGEPDNLVALVAAVTKTGADLGLAFDGDGDRITAVDSAGNIIWPDRLLMLFARDLLTRHPDAEILFDVKCSRRLPELIAQEGGQSTMWKSGHSLMKAKLRESGALLAGEMSGHFYFSERWFGFDDGLYAGARLLELLANEEGASSELFAGLPNDPATPELKIPVPEGAQQSLVEMLVGQARFEAAQVSTVDGLRVDFGNGFGLVRASNTGPNLVCRFEGATEEDLRIIKEGFRKLLTRVEPNLKLPF